MTYKDKASYESSPPCKLRSKLTFKKLKSKLTFKKLWILIWISQETAQLVTLFTVADIDNDFVF